MGVEMTTCQECGAAVADAAKHDAWHKEWWSKVADVEETANDASDKADYVSNVLYQNDISV
jgi:L-rhamnose mutarotase